ncbi:MAG: tRNA guanosine(34) transglycosylase Tgt [Anaerolineae bacterium]
MDEERYATNKKLSVLTLPRGQLQLPVFLPDATHGVVRSLDASDLLRCGVQAVQMNVFHLMQKPGSSTIKALGGLHRMFGWPKPIVTDSGGFQVYSLIHQNSKYGSLTERGMLFHPEGSSRRFHLTPEKSVQLQVDYGADIVICLDDCTDVDQPLSVQQESVERTIKWAKRCKTEFERQVELRRLESRPLLFAVVQGGGCRDLRKRCAEKLLEIGFDGFGLGGWPLDSQGNLLEEIIAYTRELIPPQFPMHALGVGQPANIVTCARMRYNLFDSTMPTRDARHGRLYLFTGDPKSSALEGNWYAYLYIQDVKNMKANQPISPYCDCPCCSNYSRAYLHHLFRVNDSLFYRLATMHNLRFVMQLMARLREMNTG